MSKPKILAYYLPQFHPIPENDNAWGNGFTEWTNLIRSKPRFDGHLLKNESTEFGQYDLRSTQVRKRHAELAKDHGIHGFVYYHYWFYGHSPEKVMYEPLERMLIDGEPNIPFCFAWANEPWTKTWDGSEKNVIIPQNYGDETGWRKHFNYLLDFFKHPNYISVNNKPILQIYRIGHFQNFSRFKQKFNEFAIEEGFSGIHFIQILNHFNDTDPLFSPLVDAYSEFHPMYVNRFSQPDVYESPEFNLHDIVAKWKAITEIEKPSYVKKPYYHGFYTGWDASPRGLNRKFWVDVNTDFSEFEKFLSRQIERALFDPNNPENLIFMFAWNEWGEGAVIEPNNIHNYQFLKSISNCVKKYN